MDSEELFKWMEENGVKVSEMADKLGIGHNTLSIYKSRGIPLKKQPLADKVTREWFDKSASDDTITAKLVIEFDDQEFDEIDRASCIAGESSIKDFIVNSTVARAREILTDSENTQQGKAG